MVWGQHVCGSNHRKKPEVTSKESQREHQLQNWWHTPLMETISQVPCTCVEGASEGIHVNYVFRARDATVSRQSPQCGWQVILCSCPCCDLGKLLTPWPSCSPWHSTCAWLSMCVGGGRKTPHLPSCGWCTEQPEMIISNLGPDLEVPDAVVFKLQPTETYRIFGLCLGWSAKGGWKAGLSIRADLSRPTSMSCSCVCHSPMGAITL